DGHGARPGTTRGALGARPVGLLVLVHFGYPYRSRLHLAILPPEIGMAMGFMSLRAHRDDTMADPHPTAPGVRAGAGVASAPRAPQPGGRGARQGRGWPVGIAARGSRPPPAPR